MLTKINFLCFRHVDIVCFHWENSVLIRCKGGRVSFAPVASLGSSVALSQTPADIVSPQG